MQRMFIGYFYGEAARQLINQGVRLKSRRLHGVNDRPLYAAYILI